MHLDSGHLYLQDLRILIFDEADTLLQERSSFERSTKLLDNFKVELVSSNELYIREPQYVFVSATISPALHEYCLQEFPRLVSVVGDQLHKSVNSVKQTFLYGAGGDFKKRMFAWILTNLTRRPTL